nr:hypothetical protein [uncultured Cellulosilyticum sp.]
MRKINSSFQTKFISEAGSKLINKDYFAFVELDKLACYVLVDGIDEDLEKKTGHLVAESIIRSFTEKPTFRKRALREYIRRAHRLLQAESREMHLKAAVTVIVTDYIKMRYVEVGNTRFYLVRNGRILYKTEDQSLSQLLVEDNKLPQDKVAVHEERHNLYTYLGQEGFMQPFISKKLKLEDGDLWALVTRGIWENCGEGELLDATSEAKEPQEVVDGVEELMLAKQPEEIDNYTIAVTFVNKVYQNPKKKITFKQVVMIALPIILIGGTLGITLYIKHRIKQNNIAQMQDYIASAEKYVQSENYLKANEDYTEALTLAKKVKDEKEKTTLDSYQKLLEQIIVADEKLQSGEYSEAQTAYLTAQRLSYEADLMGKTYIEGKLDKVQKFIDVLDLLQDGDKQMDYGEIDLARAAYQEAKTLANENFFQEGKQEAIEKIDKIDAQKAADKKEAQAAAEKKAQEDEAAQKEKEAKKAEEEKVKAEQEAAAASAAEEEQKAADEAAAKLLETKLGALEIEKQGNASYKEGNLEDAAMYYLMAQDMYRDAGVTNKVDDLYERVKIIDKMLATDTNNLSKAKLYLEEADQKAANKFYQEARMLYILSKGIYLEAGDEGAAKAIDEKIIQIDTILMAD